MPVTGPLILEVWHSIPSTLSRIWAWYQCSADMLSQIVGSYLNAENNGFFLSCKVVALHLAR